MAIKEIIISNSQSGRESFPPEIIASLNRTFENENLGRVSGSFSPGSQYVKSFVLQDGDTVFVPKNPNTITIRKSASPLGRLAAGAGFQLSSFRSVLESGLRIWGF